MKFKQVVFPREYVLWTKNNSSSFHNLKQSVKSSFMFACFGSFHALVLPFTGCGLVFSFSRENLITRVGTLIVATIYL